MVIELSKGKQAIIDEEDFEKISHCSWSFEGRYAQANIHSKKTYMHRVIMNAKKGQLVDHINGDKLDNRRSNLRFLNKSLNNINSCKPHKNNTHGTRGIFFNKRKKLWSAKIMLNYKSIFLGNFKQKEAAEAAYLHKKKEVLAVTHE